MLAGYHGDIERSLLSENVEYFRSSRLFSGHTRQEPQQQQPTVKFNKIIQTTSRPLAVSSFKKNGPGPVFTAFNPVQTQKEVPSPIRSFDHQPNLSKFHHQRSTYNPRPQSREETSPYEFKYDVSDVSYGTSFNVQVTLVKVYFPLFTHFTIRRLGTGWVMLTAPTPWRCLMAGYSRCLTTQTPPGASVRGSTMSGPASDPFSPPRQY